MQNRQIKAVQNILCAAFLRVISSCIRVYFLSRYALHGAPSQPPKFRGAALRK